MTDILDISHGFTPATAIIMSGHKAMLKSHPLLRLMTVAHYHRLVKFMVARDKSMQEILNDCQAELERNLPSACSNNIHRLYSGTVVASLQTAPEADPCVRVAKAFGVVSASAPRALLPSWGECVYSMRRLREFKELVLKYFFRMAEKLPWEQQMGRIRYYFLSYNISP